MRKLTHTLFVKQNISKNMNGCIIEINQNERQPIFFFLNRELIYDFQGYGS